MDTIKSEQAEAQNIISLFGEPIFTREFEIEINELEDEDSCGPIMDHKDNIFSNKISDPSVSLESGFIILADQLRELRIKRARTSFYLTDLENLLT